jgi:hypothetical protein
MVLAANGMSLFECIQKAIGVKKKLKVYLDFFISSQRTRRFCENSLLGYLREPECSKNV